MNQAANGVTTSFVTVVELLEFIERFLNRLDIYAWIPPMVETDELIAKIIVELLRTLAVVTEKLTQGRPSKSVLALVISYLSPCSQILKATFRRQEH
jgi:hypothetical protein